MLMEATTGARRGLSCFSSALVESEVFPRISSCPSFYWEDSTVDDAMACVVLSLGKSDHLLALHGFKSPGHWTISPQVAAEIAVEARCCP